MRILLAAGGARHPVSANELEASSIDWKRLLSMADWHGLTPLLLRHLEQLPAAVAPDHVLSALRQAAREAALRNLALASELLSISRELRLHGIQHISYKGPLLAADLYGSFASRISADLDIVVPKPKLVEAFEVLAGIGYTDKSGFNESQRAAAFQFGFEHTFQSPAGVNVDLHWRLVPTFVSPSLDESGLWQRAIVAPLCGQMVPTFGPEDLLFALCLHAGQHEWANLSLFCDLARILVRHPRLRFDTVRRHFSDSSTMRSILVSLCLLSRHWNARLPEDISASIAADRQVQQLANTVQAEFWPSADPPLPRDASLRWILQRSKHESWMDRLRYIAGITLNPTAIDYETFNLPRTFMALYPLLRGARLAVKNGRTIFGNSV